MVMEATLWAPDELPEPTAAHIDPKRRDDRAAYARAVAAGLAWYCPADCLNARGPRCDCPCGARCHGRGRCQPHR